MTKYVYLFNEGNGKMRELLGGKGANLAEMMNLGLPVPDGFTVTTEACNKYYEDGKRFPRKSESRFSKRLKRRKRSWAKSWATSKIPCSCLCAAARERPCRA